MDIISRIVPSKYINKRMYSRDFDARYGHVRNLYTNEAEFQRRDSRHDRDTVTSEISHDISSRCRATNSLTTVTEARSRFSTRLSVMRIYVVCVF